MKTYLNLQELSERTGRDVELLRQWIVAHRLPATKIGGAWMVDESLIAYIEAQPSKPWKKGNR